MSKICFGCGVKLQSDDKEKEGYVPLEKLETSEYCQRCFRMIHYGENKKTSIPKNTNDIVKSVNKNAKYVAFMVDFINIFDEVMNVFDKIRVPKTLVISKSDVIPKNVSFNQIKNYLKVIYKVTSPIIFTSNKTNLNTFIKSLYNEKEIYFLGLTNSGKSTLINAILDKYESKTKRLTTSYKENTTQDFVRIKLGNVTLVDSPGFVVDNFEVGKLTNVDDEIKPITYQNKMSCTYDIGKKLKINIEGNTSLVFYFSKHIKIERLYKNKVVGTTFKIKANRDVVICGLGFIKVTKDTTVTIPNDLMKYINIRPSIVGGVYE